MGSNRLIERNSIVASHARRQRMAGQSLVELALVLPFLMLMFAGLFDLGRVFNAYVAITNAAREGARLASTSPADHIAIAERVRAELATTPWANQISVQDRYPEGLGGGQPAEVSVWFTQGFDLITTGVLGLGRIPLRSTVIMPIMAGE